MIQKNIRKLVQYGLQTGLITEADKIYTTNRLLELFHLDEPEDGEEEPGMSVDELEEVLSAMLDYRNPRSPYTAGISGNRSASRSWPLQWPWDPSPAWTG